jgi:hypothetical protein
VVGRLSTLCADEAGPRVGNIRATKRSSVPAVAVKNTVIVYTLLVALHRRPASTCASDTTASVGQKPLEDRLLC